MYMYQVWLTSRILKNISIKRLAARWKVTRNCLRNLHLASFNKLVKETAPKEEVCLMMLLATLFPFCACWLHVRTETVSTKYGDIDGLVTSYPNASGPFKSVSKFFVGVPFAAPATGELRVKSPKPPKEWKPKVYSAKTHGSVCLQPKLFENFIEPGKFHFQRGFLKSWYLQTKQYWLFRWKYCILLSI